MCLRGLPKLSDQPKHATLVAVTMHEAATTVKTRDRVKQGCKQKAGNSIGKVIAGKHAFRKVYTGEALGPFTSILSIRTPLKPLLRANSLMSLLLPGSWDRN